jgi:hypothetical protein
MRAIPYRPLVLLLPVLLLLLVAVPAAAQCTTDQDEICILFDPEAAVCTNCVNFTGGTLFAYVLLLNPSEPSGVLGFEFCHCGLPPPPSYYLVQYHYPPQWTGSVSIEPCFALGLETPIPWAPAVQLIGIELLVFGNEPWCFGVEPLEEPSLPDAMAYAAGDDPLRLVAMRPCTGPQQDPCRMACVNDPACPPPVAAERTTWGAVKGVYR